MRQWRVARGRFVVMTIVAAATTQSLTAQAALQQPQFVAEMHAAMQKMMTAMDLTPTGDVDADFAAMMIPHHVGAIAMAQAELKAGRNEQLRRLAQEIIITQQQEIAVMRLALTRGSQSEAGSPAAASPSRTRNGVDEATRTGAALPVSHRDRVYAAEQFSNTVSVTDPVDNTLLGVIRLGDPTPGNMSPLYRGQLLVHGLGFSPDHRTLAVVSIGSNSVTFIDTATNAVKRVTYVGRSPHEAFFTPEGKEVWVTVRGESYVAVLDGITYEERARIAVPSGPGMQIFSPDGQYGYICSSFTAETVVVSVAEHRIVGRVPQESPFCPDIAATPDGKQIWFTLKDVGKVSVFEARAPFALVKTIETGPITNHVNFAYNAEGVFAYVTVGGLDQVQVFRTDDFSRVATIPVGKLPHGLWPSGDGSRMYVGLENADQLIAIDTATHKVIGAVPIGQAPQAVVYVPNAVSDGPGTQHLEPLGAAGETTQLTLAPRHAAKANRHPTSVTLFDQGLTQVLQASVTGLEVRRPYVLALSDAPDGGGTLEPLAAFTTNPQGSAIVNAVGPIRQVVQGDGGVRRRYLAIAPGTAARHGKAVQVQVQR
jgi:YVTN family beta-propeller protein